MHNYLKYRYKVWNQAAHVVMMLIPFLALCCLMYVLLTHEINSHQSTVAIFLIIVGIQQGWIMSVNHYTCYKRGRDRIIISDESILCHTPNVREIEIRWKDISDIKDMIHLQRLEIIGCEDDKIVIGYQVQNFSSLIQVIVEQTKQSRIINSKLNHFSKSAWWKARQWIGLLAVVLISISVFFNPITAWFDAIIYVFSIAVIWGITSNVWSIDIEDASIILHKIVGSITVHSSEIKDVAYRDEYDHNMHSNEPYVLLEVMRKNAKKLQSFELEGYREGLLSLGESLKRL